MKDREIRQRFRDLEKRVTDLDELVEALVARDLGYTWTVPLDSEGDESGIAICSVNTGGLAMKATAGWHNDNDGVYRNIFIGRDYSKGAG